VRAVRYRESAVNRQLFRQYGCGDFVESRAAEFFRNAAADEPDFGGFANEFRHQTGLLIFEIFDERQNFFHYEFFCRLADQFLIVGEVGGREHIRRRGRFQQKASAFSRCSIQSSRGHRLPP
jgi:hypothetical protein